MNDYKIFTAFLLVSILLVPVVQSVPRQGESPDYTITTVGGSGGGGGNVNLTDGSSCSAANQCVNSYCVHSICRSASTFCGDAFCDSGETCSSCSGDCGACPAAAAAAAPSGGGAVTSTPKKEEKKEEKPASTPTPTVTPSVEVVKIEVPITNIQTIQEVITAVKAADLGVDTIKIENLEIKKTGVAETTTTTQTPVLEKVVEDALTVVTEESAKQALNEIRQAVSAGSSAPISVTTSVEVFEIKEKTTEKIVFTSKVTITLKPAEDLKDINIVKVIPKSVAASISEVIFLGEQPKVLQADPVVQWEFAEVKKDEVKDLSYQVGKKIEKLEADTVAVAKVVYIVAPPKTSLIVAYILIGVILGGVAVYVVYKRFFKPSSFKYHYKTKR